LDNREPLMAAVKVLVSGDVRGKFKDFFARLEQVTS
jgi:hypothetical protein